MKKIISLLICFFVLGTNVYAAPNLELNAKSVVLVKFNGLTYEIHFSVE